MVIPLGSLIDYVLIAFCRIPLLISPSKGTNPTSRVKEAREAKEVREVREATKEATTIVSLSFRVGDDPRRLIPFYDFPGSYGKTGGEEYNQPPQSQQGGYGGSGPQCMPP